MNAELCVQLCEGYNSSPGSSSHPGKTPPSRAVKDSTAVPVGAFSFQWINTSKIRHKNESSLHEVLSVLTAATKSPSDFDYVGSLRQGLTV